MAEMTSHERYERVFKHQESDRIPLIDDIWTETKERWIREGMPADADINEYFDLDSMTKIFVNISPNYEEKTIEETEDYKIVQTAWGVTAKNWKHRASTPLFLDHKVKDLDSWLKAKARMQTDLDKRIDWNYLEKNYPLWKKNNHWIQALLWFGFDVTHAWVVGTEPMLVAMVEEPEMVKDMFDTFLDLNLQLFDRIWDAGYRFDSILWYDDMGYKYNQFFSLNMYRNLLKPSHQRACEWAREKGIHTHLHSCGDIHPFIPDLIEIGVECLNPLEVKAGMDPVALKKQYGDKLAFHGGINAVLWDDKEAIMEEMRKVIPVMKEKGGYIFSSDHSVPATVSLQNFKDIIQEAKILGKY